MTTNQQLAAARAPRQTETPAMLPPLLENKGQVLIFEPTKTHQNPRYQGKNPSFYPLCTHQMQQRGGAAVHRHPPTAAGSPDLIENKGAA